MAKLDDLLKQLGGRGGISRPAFTPTASPVRTVATDLTFNELPRPVEMPKPQAPMAPRMPQAPAPSNVDQLVSALASLNPQLNRFMGSYFEEQNKQDRLDAEVKYLQDNSPASWSEAVKRDPTLLDRSPVFRQVYESRVARTAVQQRAASLISEYHNSPIAASEDPSAITGWLQERMKDLLDVDASPAAKEALVEEIQTIAHRFQQAHAEVARKNLWEKNQQSLSVRYQTTFDGYRALGPAVPYQTDDPVIAANVGKDGDPRAAMKAAFLNAVAGGESAGKYNIRYDGGAGSLFDINGMHPRIFVPTKGGEVSSAAGRYQFVWTTWNELGFGNKPMTPENQDKAALMLAERDYKARTGRNLWDDMEKEGFSPRIQAVLTPTWQALKGNRGRHLATYNASLQKYGGKPTGPGVQNAHIPEMVEEVRKIEQEASAQGMTFSQINELTLNAVINNAITNQDESILEVATLSRPHGLSVDQAKQIEDARARIRNLRVQAENDRKKIEDAAKEARQADVTQKVAAAMLAQMKPGPNGEPPKSPTIPTEILEAANAEDPELFKELVDLQKNLDTVHKIEDPNAVADLTARVYAGRADQREVLQAVSRGTLKNQITMGQLLEFAGRGSNDNPLNDPGVDKIISSIETVVGQKDNLQVLRNPTAAGQALAHFSGGLMRFKQLNPTASPMQIFEEARKLQAEVMELYASPGDLKKFKENSPEARMAKKAQGGTSAVTAPTTPQPSKPGEQKAEAAPPIEPRKVEYTKVPVYPDRGTLDSDFAAYMKGATDNNFARWLKANGILGNPQATVEFLQAQRRLLETNTSKG